MPVKSEREYRNFEVRALEPEAEQEAAARQIVTGYASTFGNPYVLYSDNEYEIREVMDAHAFDETDLRDVIMQYDHEGRVFARVSNGTLKVSTDERGLAIEGDLSGTELGRQVYAEIKGGYTDKMSIGMKVDKTRDIWTTETLAGKTIETRTINKVDRLYDVSAVSIPANDATSISVRTLVDGEINRLKAERLEAQRLELERRRAETRARALGGIQNE